MAVSSSISDKLDSPEQITSTRLKNIIRAVGAILLLIGIPPTLNLLCITPLTMLDGSPDTPVYVLVSLILALITVGAGGVMFYHANRSLNGKPSGALRLPSMFLLMDIFVAILIVGLYLSFSEVLRRLFLPVFILAAAALPPLAAISWFLDHKKASPFKLSWRRGVVAFAGGASAGLCMVVLLATLLIVVILALSPYLYERVSESLSSFLNFFEHSRWAAALTNSGFVYIFLQTTLIAPLVEEFAKPLALLPVLRRLDRQETFLIGALAGAGFAVLENSIYAAFGIKLWIEILFVLALGSAIQPLGSGLVALGWREVLRREPGAWGLLTRRYGVAVVIHALWNAGSLLAIVFGEAFIKGNFLPETGMPGLVATGCLLVSLTLLGFFALWLGRALGQDKLSLFTSKPADTEAVPTNRAIAIWALACLLMILPVGVILSRLWLR